MKEGSKLLPIVGLFTNSSSNESIIEEFKKKSSAFKSEYEVDFTHVDCLQTSFCTTQVQIKEFPSIFVIQGPYYFYWRKIIMTNKLENEINEIMKSNKFELISDEHQSNYIEKVYNGGSLFELKISPRSQLFFQYINKYIKYYQIFNSSFIYSYDDKIETPIITSYYSPNCFKRKRIRPIDVEQLLEDNKFSFYHIYHEEELKENIEISPFISIIFKNEFQFNYSKEKVFDLFNHFCGKFKFGFINSQMNVKFMKAFLIENLTQPFIFAINPFKNCYSTFSIDSNKSDFENVLNGSKCKPINSKLNLSPRKSRSKLTMFSFSLTFAFVFGIFYCLNTRNRDDPFLERQYNNLNVHSKFE